MIMLSNFHKTFANNLVDSFVPYVKTLQKFIYQFKLTAKMLVPNTPVRVVYASGNFQAATVLYLS